MKVQTDVTIHNRFDIVVQDRDTGEIKQTAVAYNNIMATMWTRLCAGSTFFTHIQFGTGTGALSAARTTLFTFLGGKAATLVTTVRALPTSSIKKRVVLAPEEFVGSVLTEVAVAYQATTGGIVTHAMLKDGAGNPISITKTSVDVVTIYATIFVTINVPEGMVLTKLSTNQLVNYLVAEGVSPTGSFKLGACSIPSQSGSVSARVTSSMALGTTADATWIADAANKRRSTAIMRFGVTVGNGNAEEFGFDNIFRCMLPTTGVFTGQPYTGVSIGNGDGIKNKYLLPALNVRQTSLIVYLNGIETSDYTKELIYGLNFNYNVEYGAMPIQGIAWSRDSKVFAFASGASYTNSTISVFDIVDGVFVARSLMSKSDGAGVKYGLSLSADGSVLAMINGFANYWKDIYDWDGTKWIARAYESTVTNNTSQRALCCISDDGTVFVGEGSGLFILDWSGSSWTKRGTLPVAGSTALKLSMNKNSIFTVDQTERFWVYDWSGTVWIKRPMPPPVSPAFSPMAYPIHGSITEDFNTVALAYLVSPWIVIYRWNGTAWIQDTVSFNDLISDNSKAIDISSDGTRIIVVCGVSPYIEIFDLINGVWVKKDMAIPTIGRPTLTSTNRGIFPSPDGKYIAFPSQDLPYVAIWDTEKATTQITFNTPPPEGAVITADYTVDGVHKTTDYVIDVSMTIQYGEPV